MTVESAVRDIVATVVFKAGDVYLIKDKKSKLIERGESIPLGSLLKTGSHSIALIKVVANLQKRIITSMVKVGQRSQLKILPFKDIPQIKLDSGNLVVKVFNLQKSKLLKLKVTSRVAALGVRGTEFFVYADKQKQFTTLREGELEMIGAHGRDKLRFNAGVTVATNEQQQLIRPRKFAWQKQINWKLSGKARELYQPVELFTAIELSWQKYKQEQQFIYQQHKQSEKNKFNNWRESNDKLRHNFFSN